MSFRVWNKKIKAWLVWFTIRDDGTILDSNLSGAYENWQEDCIIEQATGIKDKNSTEIYEGDIVSLRLWGGNEYEYENGIVRYYQPSAAFKWFSLEDDENDCNNYWLQHAESDGREVIGNIHENPELLKANR